MSKYIYIYYEIYKREFLSNLLLAIIASKKNFKIYLGTNDVFKLLIKNKLIVPGIFHTKSLTHGSDKKNLHKDLKKNNFILTSIDQEHGVINSGSYDEIFIKPRIHEDDIKLCNAYFCWGNYDYKNLKKKFKDKIFYLTGSPRVDLWKSRFNNFWNKDKNIKKYVLFVSNLSFTNNHYSFEDIIKRKELNNYYKRAPKIKKEEIAFYKYQKKSMKKFISLIKNFSNKFPKEKIILRPHPTEKLDLWEKVLKNCKNISIKGDGELSSYIKNAKCVVQDGCTSAMESYISNVPIINFVPIKTNQNVFGQFIKKISINITKEDEFFQLIKLKKYRILREKKYIVNSRMIYLSKQLSATKIVKVWNNFFTNKKILQNYKKKYVNNNIKIFIYLYIYQNIRYLVTNIVLFLKGKMFLKKIFEHKNKKLDVKDINKTIDKLTKSIGIKNNIDVSKLGKDLILITSKAKK